MTKSSKAIGIDGCRAGWCVAIQSQEGLWIELWEDIHRIKRVSTSAQICIDIPIGLPSKNRSRTCDDAARKQLGRGASSVFGVPCRKAVYAESYQGALKINRQILGKGFSIQSWNICGKIREVDHFLIEHPNYQPSFYECHPELAFLHLNDAPLRHKKKTPEGHEERLSILESYSPSIRDCYAQGIADYKRKEVARDDIIDALALMVVSELSRMNPLSTVEVDQFDSEGVRMNIHYHNPHGNDTSPYSR